MVRGNVGAKIFSPLQRQQIAITFPGCRGYYATPCHHRRFIRTDTVGAKNFSPLQRPEQPNNGSGMNNIPHHRRSIRLHGYDYTQAGVYFITLCTQNREHLFGEIVNGEMLMHDAGRIVAECWEQIPRHFPDAELDEWVVMPNHVHGIVIITDSVDTDGVVGAKPVEANPVRANPVRAKNFSPLPPLPDSPLQQRQQRPTGTSRTIGSIVRGFKIGVTKWYRQQSIESVIWQRNYWEHIVRNEPELDRIRHYIANNPVNWETDQLNCLMIGPGKNRGDECCPGQYGDGRGEKL